MPARCANTERADPQKGPLMSDSTAQPDSTALADGPFDRFPDNSDAIRAQIETLKAITAYYTAATGQVTAPRFVIPEKRVDEALRKINDSPRFASGGVIYPTKVEIVDTSRGPEAAITFAWNPDQPHRLNRNEAIELRHQLSQFLFDSANQPSPKATS